MNAAVFQFMTIVTAVIVLVGLFLLIRITSGLLNILLTGISLAVLIMICVLLANSLNIGFNEGGVTFIEHMKQIFTDLVSWFKGLWS